MNRLPVVVGCVLLMQVLCANAQTYYVDDRLQVGLHAQPALSSTISELLPSGTELEVLERNDALAKVRTAEGLEGWVDASFITSQPPARARVASMEAELAGAQAALADLQAKFVALEQRPERIATERAADDSGTLPSDALREMQMLAEENQRLKQQIAEREALNRMAQERSAGASPAMDSADSGLFSASMLEFDRENFSVALIRHWHLLLIASVLLLAFAIGGWLVDWRIRRRHGGFRV